MAFYHKAHRSVLRIHGEGALQFLHDILTADCLSVPAGGMRQSCLLSPQGRILAEMILYPKGPDDVYLDIDESQAEDTLKKLRLYRLRRPLTLSREEDLHVIACMDEVPAMADIAFVKDARHEAMGYLALISQSQLAALSFAPYEAYLARRLSLALPEGPLELTPNRALMLEAGLDLIKAVDFKKGCYIGQEVTARTHYRGLVKKRLLPITAPHLAAEMPVICAGKTIGTLHHAAPYNGQMIGLATLKLAAVHEILDGTASCEAEGAPAEIALPDWMPPLPKPDDKTAD